MHRGLGLLLGPRMGFCFSFQLFLCFSPCASLGLNFSFELRIFFGLKTELCFHLLYSRGIRFSLFLGLSSCCRDSLCCLGFYSGSFLDLNHKPLFNLSPCLGFFLHPLLSLKPGHRLGFRLCFGPCHLLGLSLHLLFHLLYSRSVRFSLFLGLRFYRRDSLRSLDLNPVSFLDLSLKLLFDLGPCLGLFLCLFLSFEPGRRLRLSFRFSFGPFLDLGLQLTFHFSNSFGV